MVIISLHITPLLKDFQGFAIAYQLKSKLLLNQSTLRACFQSYLHQLPQITHFSARLGYSFVPDPLLTLQHCAYSFKGKCKCHFRHTVFPHSSFFPQGCPKVDLISSSHGMFGYLSYGIIYTLPWGKGI